LEKTGIDGKIMQKLLCEKWGMKLWAGGMDSARFQQVPRTSFCETSDKSSASSKTGRFFDSMRNHDCGVNLITPI
jgi:hypothetical protein